MNCCEIRQKKGKSTFQGAILALAMGLFQCGGDPQPRTYSEVAFKELPAPGAGGMGAMGGMGALPATNASPVDIKVTWELPGGWMGRNDTSGMRVGSFSVPDSQLMDMGEMDPKAVDVSVVQLAGDAGGLEANIRRWMGQVGLKASAGELKALIDGSAKLKARTGQEGLFVDLTEMLSGDMTQSKSIYGAIITTADYTVFVKGMGDRERVVKAKNQIKAFCESLSIKGPEA